MNISRCQKNSQIEQNKRRNHQKHTGSIARHQDQNPVQSRGMEQLQLLSRRSDKQRTCRLQRQPLLYHRKRKAISSSSLRVVGINELSNKCPFCKMHNFPDNETFTDHIFKHKKVGRWELCEMIVWYEQARINSTRVKPTAE